MRMTSIVRLSILAFSLVLVPSSAPAQRVAGAAVRGAERAAKRAIAKQIDRVLARDLARDALLKPRALKVPRTTFRYTTRKAAELELKRGIPVGRHMTAKAGAGRPLTANGAQRRYGLPAKPQVRETIELPRGQSIRVGKVIGGQPGVGEITAANRLPKEAIKRVVPIR